jgi:hypothetical protein
MSNTLVPFIFLVVYYYYTGQIYASGNLSGVLSLKVCDLVKSKLLTVRILTFCHAKGFHQALGFKSVLRQSEMLICTLCI